MGGLMGMHVLVRLAFTMEMDMLVRLFPDGSVQSPDKVGKPKTNKEPCGRTPAERLDGFKLKNRCSQSNPHKTENDRAQHMS
jgi:hypothetical protein